MTRMNFVYTGILVGVLAVVAAGVVANGEVGSAELRLVEGARSAVETVVPANGLALNTPSLPATTALD